MRKFELRMRFVYISIQDINLEKEIGAKYNCYQNTIELDLNYWFLEKKLKMAKISTFPINLTKYLKIIIKNQRLQPIKIE